MSAEFTRAPWMAASGPSSIVGWPVVSCGAGPGAGRSIASVSWMPGLPDEAVEEIRANANLIAAAPELYEALEGLVRYAEAVRMAAGMGKTQLARLEAGKAALAKARAAQADKQ